MQEEILRRFFLGELDAKALSADLQGAVVAVDEKISRQFVEPMDQEFEVVPAHLIRLCDSVLKSELPPSTLETIAFCLIASDQYHYENKRIARIIFDWDNPKMNFPLSMNNIASWRRELEGHDDVHFETKDGRQVSAKERRDSKIKHNPARDGRHP